MDYSFFPTYYAIFLFLKVLPIILFILPIILFIVHTKLIKKQHYKLRNDDYMELYYLLTDRGPRLPRLMELC